MADDQHLEQLSSLVDSELDDPRARFLVSRLIADPELEQRWKRYHMIGCTLRREHPRRTTLDLTGRVARALEDEATPSMPRSTGGMLKPVAGLAIAASVAITAFTLLSRSPDIAPEPLLASEPVVSERPTNANFDAAPGLPQRASVASGTQLNRAALTDPRVQAYLLRHNEAAVRRGQGLVPYLQMATAPAGTEESNAGRQDRPGAE